MKEDAIDLIFCKMCSISPPIAPELIDWMRERASDSKIAWETSISEASKAPWSKVRASVTFAVKGAART